MDIVRIVCALGLAAVFAAPAPAQDVKSLRQQAVDRPRRLIFDNDGNEPVYYMDAATPEALLACRTAPLADSQVDTIVYCTWSSGFGYFTHDTKVGAPFTSTAEEPGKGPGSGFSKNKTQALLDQGLDPLRIVVDWCKTHDVEIFWSMRMNDIHDAWGAWYSPHLFPPIKQAHPEWLMGTPDKKPVNGAWTSMDYGVPEVRDYAFRFIEEVCQNYDVDGVMLDFFRHLAYVRGHAWGGGATPAELDAMTDLIRRVRAMADARGRERGRAILLAVRVPDSVKAAKIAGLDIERWMAEDLIDLLVPSGYFRLNYWDVTTALAHKYGVKVYPCLSESRLRDAEAKRARASEACYRGRAMNAWHAGADGVYLFNFFNPNSALWWQLAAPETIVPHERMYCTGARGIGNLSFWIEGGQRLVNRDLLSPSHPRKLTPGDAAEVTLVVGERLADQDGAAVSLALRTAGLEDAAALDVALNGTPLEGGALDGHWLTLAVAPALVHDGHNRIALRLSEGAPAAVAVNDLQLWVRP